MNIRKVSLHDIEKLKEIGKLTFAETFSSDNSEENMFKYLENAFSTKKLTTELTSKNSEFYFAELDGKVIGYLKVNIGESQTEIKESWMKKVSTVFKEATLEFNEKAFMQQGGKEGIHTEHLGFLLAEMQFLQRAYPGCTW